MLASNVFDLSTTTVDRYLAETTGDAGFAAEVAIRSGRSPGDTAILLGDLASETRRAARMLSDLPLRRGARILEVGSGPGLVAGLLHRHGADVTGLDPVVDGYDAFMAVRSVLTDQGPMPSISKIPALMLDPAVHGHFDVIFSVNVLEHMRPLEANLDALASVLSPGGRMIHTCPNYRVPYEPHYRVALVPGRPGWTRHIARRAGREPVWHSLNWITAGDVRRFARRHDLALTFRTGEMMAALERLRYDPEFARRQRGPVVGGLRALDTVGIARLMGRLPATWMTPMTFTLTRVGLAVAGDDRVQIPRQPGSNQRD